MRAKNKARKVLHPSPSLSFKFTMVLWISIVKLLPIPAPLCRSWFQNNHLLQRWRSKCLVTAIPQTCGTVKEVSQNFQKNWQDGKVLEFSMWIDVFFKINSLQLLFLFGMTFWIWFRPRRLADASIIWRSGATLIINHQLLDNSIYLELVMMSMMNEYFNILLLV